MTSLGKSLPVLLLLLLSHAVQAQGQTAPEPNLTFTLIEFPGAISTSAYGINSDGDIVGSYVNAIGEGAHGFLLRHGQYTSIDYPGAAGTVAWGINDKGQIVGYEGDERGFPFTKGFVYDGQSFRVISDPGEPDTECYGINNAGDIVGRHGEGKRGVLRGFKFSRGHFTPIVPPGQFVSEGAAAINNRGEIVGFRYNSCCVDSFLYKAGEYRFLFLGDGSNASIANGINDHEVIVGWSVAGGRSSGFVFKAGKYITIRYPGAYSTALQGINNSGVMIGNYHEGVNFGFHSFVTSPISDADFAGTLSGR